MAQDIDTGTPDLLATLDDGVLTLTLNRPDARNAMSRGDEPGPAAPAGRRRVQTRREVHRADRRRQGLLRRRRRQGHGRRGDGTVGALTIDEAIHRQRVNQRATAGKLFKMPKPTLAALPGRGCRRGPVAGAGL
jgi:2-(1,2-epoxy-1,2-dihydrophenyl)acetyl-CoA isomerase